MRFEEAITGAVILPTLILYGLGFKEKGGEGYHIPTQAINTKNTKIFNIVTGYFKNFLITLKQTTEIYELILGFFIEVQLDCKYSTIVFSHVPF